MTDAETFSMRRCALALALSFPIVIVPFIASAAEVVPYTSPAFAAAQKAGDPILGSGPIKVLAWVRIG